MAATKFMEKNNELTEVMVGFCSYNELTGEYEQMHTLNQGIFVETEDEEELQVKGIYVMEKSNVFIGAHDIVINKRDRKTLTQEKVIELSGAMAYQKETNLEKTTFETLTNEISVDMNELEIAKTTEDAPVTLTVSKDGATSSVMIYFSSPTTLL